MREDKFKEELDRLYPPETMKGKDNEINKWMYKDILKLVKAFPKGHSGASAHYLINIFCKLMRGKSLTPLTNNPNEWMEITEEMSDGKIIYQSRRKSSCFINDNKIEYYYDINEQKIPKWKRLFVKNMNGFKLYKLKGGRDD